MHITGKTVDNKIVVAGVYHYKSTYGLPLDVIVDTLRSHNIVPDWYQYIQDSLDHKQNIRSTFIEIERVLRITLKTE